MGPCLDLVMRRIRMADPEAEKEAFKTASITKKKASLQEGFRTL